MLPHVELRPGVYDDLHVSLLVDPRPDCEGGTVLAVHGAAGNASNWEPLAQAMFAQPRGGRGVCRIAALARLDALGIRVATVMGESAGSVVLQFAQQILAERGTSLRRALHVAGRSGRWRSAFSAIRPGRAERFRSFSAPSR